MSDDSTDFRQWDAAYVLGALSPQDRTRFAQYLAHNPDRAADIAELAGLPGILKSLSVDEAVALLRPINDSHREHRTHHAAALQRLARTVTRRRRRVRTSVITVAIVAAAALITGSLFIGTLVAPTNTTAHSTVPAPAPQGGEAVERPMVAVQANTLTANLRVTPKPWGTLLSWNCIYLARWAAGTKKLGMVVTSTSGIETIVATWTASGTHAGNLAAATSIPTVDIRTVTIRPEGDPRPLLQASP